MCGIVGLVSSRDVVEPLIHGLKMLEYRGYDSAGIEKMQLITRRVSNVIKRISNLD